MSWVTTADWCMMVDGGLRTWTTWMIIDEHHTAKWMTMIGNYPKTRLILVIHSYTCKWMYYGFKSQFPILRVL